MTEVCFQSARAAAPLTHYQDDDTGTDTPFETINARGRLIGVNDSSSDDR
jgi:hypothetical protein